MVENNYRYSFTRSSLLKNPLWQAIRKYYRPAQGSVLRTTGNVRSGEAFWWCSLNILRVEQDGSHTAAYKTSAARHFWVVSLYKRRHLASNTSLVFVFLVVVGFFWFTGVVKTLSRAAICKVNVTSQKFFYSGFSKCKAIVAVSTACILAHAIAVWFIKLCKIQIWITCIK